MVVKLSEKIRKSSGSGAHVRNFTRGVDYDTGEARGGGGGGGKRPPALPMGGGGDSSLEHLLAAAEQLGDDSGLYGNHEEKGNNTDRGKMRTEGRQVGHNGRVREGLGANEGSRHGSWTAERERSSPERRRPLSARGGYRANQPTFPLKLFDLVTTEPGAIGWTNEGLSVSSFHVIDIDKFVNVLLPRYFKREIISLSAICSAL